MSENDLKSVRDILVDFLSKDHKESMSGLAYKSVPVDLGSEGQFDLYVFAQDFFDPNTCSIGFSLQKKEDFRVDNLTRGASYVPSMAYFKEHFYGMRFQFDLQRKLALINEDMVDLLKSNK